MSFRARAFSLGAVAAMVCMLLTPLATQAAPEVFTWGSFNPDGSSAYGVFGPDNATALQRGEIIQLIYAGPDGAIDLPYCDGQPGGDDELLQASTVQNEGALPNAAHNKGYVPFNTLTFDASDPRSGGVVYIRAWNAAATREAPYQRAGALRLLDWSQGPFATRMRPAAVWGDSSTAILTGGAVFNAPRWRTNRVCSAARSKVAALLSDVRPAAAHAAPLASSSSWSLLAWPLLPYNITLDGVLGTQLYGTADPTTADRVLVWDGATQTYSSAWFCGSPDCNWGPAWTDHWLADDLSPSSLTLPPDAGFWIESRKGVVETLSIVGDVAPSARVVSVGTGWQLLGSAIPVSRTLDLANLPATGSGSPDTADRVLYWDAANQRFVEAWFCGLPDCNWGEPWTNHWLAGDYSPTTIVIGPGHGFWYQNRHAAFTWTNPLP